MNILFLKILNFFKTIFYFNLADFSWIKTSKFIDLDNIDVFINTNPIKSFSSSNEEISKYFNQQKLAAHSFSLGMMKHTGLNCGRAMEQAWAL